MTSQQNTNEDFEGEAWVSRVRANVNPKQERNKRQTKAKREDFIHSLNTDSKDLKAFLAKVPEEIEKAANHWGISLNDNDVAALYNPKCRGYYPLYIPEDCKYGKEKMKLKSLLALGKSPEEIKEYHRDNHNIYIGRSPRFSRNISAATCRNYEQVCRGFWNYLAIVGRYDEMIMLLPHPPKLQDDAVPSISPTSIKEYVLHRYSEPFSILWKNGDETNGPVKDINGCEVRCEGTVKNYEWFDTIFAAVKYVHIIAGKNGGYQESCPACLALNGDDPCEPHQGNGKTRIHYARSKGDPTFSFVISELRKWLELENKRREYKPNRRSPFLPDDFTKFHSELQRRLVTSFLPAFCFVESSHGYFLLCFCFPQQF